MKLIYTCVAELLWQSIAFIYYQCTAFYLILVIAKGCQRRLFSSFYNVNDYVLLPHAAPTPCQFALFEQEGNPIGRRQLMALPGADAWLERCAKTKQKDVALYMS